MGRIEATVVSADRTPVRLVHVPGSRVPRRQKTLIRPLTGRLPARERASANGAMRWDDS